MPNPLHHALISDLLRSMEQEGIAMGTGLHLKVQELWSKLPEDLEPERLKTILTPVFATNPQEQERFYTLFDRSLKRVQNIQKVEEVKSELPPKEEIEEKNWRWLLLGAAGLLTLILLAIFWRANDVTGPVNNFREIPLNLNRGDTLVHDPILRKNEEDTLRNLAFLDGELYAVDSIWGEYEIDSLHQLIIRGGDTIGRSVDTLIIRALYNTGLDSMHFIIHLRELPAPDLEEEEKETPEKQAPRLKTKEIPYAHDLPLPDEAAIQKAEFWQNNKWWIKSLLILLLGFLLWSLVQWLERRKRKAVAQLQRAHQTPPYVWTVDLDEPEELAVGIQAKQLTNRLRKRQLEDYHRINIPETVKATARSAGQVHLQYSQPSKPSEYLLLIDRNAMQDHRALLFDNLYESFKQEEVHISRYFYDASPQVVFNEKYPNGLSLKDLQHSNSESRLLIVGDGKAFFNPNDGEWADWVEELNNWKARGLLSTQPLNKWAYDEELLAKKFLLLPASLQGVDRLIEQFELVEPKPWEEMVKLVNDASKENIVFRDDLMTTLEYYYPEPAMRNWIAACAVYPQLQWKLTLHLGKELSSEDFNLLTVENILALVRLPWFVEGKIPDPVRTLLIDYLKEQGLEGEIRATIKKLLDKAPKPSTDSVAYEKWKVNQLFNEIQVIPPSLERRKLKEELKNYLEAGYQPDAVTLEVLEKENTPPLASGLSDRWKEYLFREGETIFGWKGWVWAAPLWLLLSALILLFNPQFNTCKGELVLFEGQSICIQTDEDRIIYNDHLSRKIIRENDNLKGFKKATMAVITFQDFNNVYADPSENELGQSITQTLINDLRRNSNLLIYSTDSLIELLQPGESIVEVRKNLGIEFNLTGDYNQEVNPSVVKSFLTDDEDNELSLKTYELNNLDPNEISVLLIPNILNKINEQLNPLIAIYKITNQIFPLQNQYNIYSPFQLVENPNEPSLYSKIYDQEIDSLLSDLPAFYQAYLPSRLKDPLELQSVMITPLQDSLQAFNQKPVDDRPRALGDQYIENLATALYNKGVILFNRYLDIQEGLIENPTEPADSLLDYSAFNLLLAKDLQTNQPEILSALLRVYGEDPSQRFPAVINGFVTDEYEIPLVDVEVSIGDSIVVLTEESGQFHMDLPAGWTDNIVSLNYFKPGFLRQNLQHVMIDENSDQVQTIILRSVPPVGSEEDVVIFTDPQTRSQGVRTQDGQTIIPATYGRIEIDPETGYFRAETRANRAGTKFGYYTQSGRIVVPAIYPLLEFYSGGLALARDDNGKLGYINTAGNIEHPFNFSDAESYQDGQAKVAIRNPISQDTVQFYINVDGECTTNCPYVDIFNAMVNATCDVNNREEHQKYLLETAKAEDVAFVLTGDFTVLYYPDEIMDRQNCANDEYEIAHSLLPIYARAAPFIPNSGWKEVTEYINSIKANQNVYSRLEKSMGTNNLRQMIATIEQNGPPMDEVIITNLSLPKLERMNPGDFILSYYFDVNVPTSRADNYQFEETHQAYVNKIMAQPSTSYPTFLINQIGRLNKLLDNMIADLENNFGTSIEIKGFSDSDERFLIVNDRVKALVFYISNYKNKILQPYLNNGVIEIVEAAGESPQVNTNQTAPNNLSQEAIQNRRVDISFVKRTQHQDVQRPVQSNELNPFRGSTLGTQDLDQILKQIQENMISLNGASYQMGCTQEQQTDCENNEKPVRQVSVPNFDIGKYEVSNAEFCAFLNDVQQDLSQDGNVWRLNDPLIYIEDQVTSITRLGNEFVVQNGSDNFPVVGITWHGAKAFVNWLSQKTGLNYDLPSEAQWEFAARGGVNANSAVYAGTSKLDDFAWYLDNAKRKVQQVGQKEANELGIYDMSGNVREWTLDEYFTSYDGAPTDGSARITRGNVPERVTRGGSWYSSANECRVSARKNYAATDYDTDLGFRIVRRP